MFGKNKIVTFNDFKNENPETLKLTSVFYTLQGEGIYSGQRAVFVRLTGCNLQCSFCDTYFDSGDEYTFDQILFLITQSVKDFDKKHKVSSNMDNLLIVLTGGEPMLQPNVVKFAEFCHSKNFRTQTESNGLVQKTTLEMPKETTVIISPKVNEKTGKYLEPSKKVLERADALKFVISSTDSSYGNIPDFALEWMEKTKKPVYVSPMNMYLNKPNKIGEDGTIAERSTIDETISFWTPNLLDPTANQANHEYAALIAMKHGALLSLQTHLYASLP